MAIRVAAILACCAGLNCTAAFAQWNPGITASLGQGLGSIALSQSVLSGTRLIGQSSVGRGGVAAATPHAPATATLTYVTEPRVSDRVRGAMIDVLSKQNPELRPKIARAFANDEVLRNFDRFMRSRGWSSHDIADDMAMLLLVGWETVTSRDATAAQIEGARRQLHGVFRQTPQLRAMTNADRQVLGEQIAYEVVITSLVRQQAVRSGDRAQLAQLRQSTATLIKQQGVDLTRLTLTDRGFSAAS